MLAAACGLDQNREDFDEDDLYTAMDELNGHYKNLLEVLKDLKATSMRHQSATKAC